MSVIENFAALPAKEQREFATALIKTINSESIFSADTNFEITGVEADDLTGGLWIEVSHPDPINVPRKATWQVLDEEEADTDPGYEAEYVDSIYEDAKSAFKTLSTVIDGYEVTLTVDDADADETVDIEVQSMSHEDAGIGHYEYWGHDEFDSRPYLEVTGVITKACTCSLVFFVEPVDEPITETETEEEI
jgi:hypothetical protein